MRIRQAIDPLIGRELDGRYKVVEKIGEGGMGTVYRGTQHSVGRECAIKVLNPSLVSEPTAIKRFLREARLSSKLAHPNAVSVLDFGQTDDGVFFLVMELVTGRTLDKVLHDGGALSPPRVVRIGAQICDALEGAHALEIIHRDLKPANVMIMATGRDLVKVLDFGLARTLSPQVVTQTTHAGMLLGTPAYMPPELINGQSCDGRADLYSLGCLLYEAASGRLPHAGATAHEMIAMHLHDRPERLTCVPRKLALAIERMLAKSPHERFATAAEAREALEAALLGGLEESIVNVDGFGSTLLGWSNDTVRSQPSPTTPPRASSTAIPPAAPAPDAPERKPLAAKASTPATPRPISPLAQPLVMKPAPDDHEPDADTMAQLALESAPRAELAAVLDAWSGPTSPAQPKAPVLPPSEPDVAVEHAADAAGDRLRMLQVIPVSEPQRSVIRLVCVIEDDDDDPELAMAQPVVEPVPTPAPVVPAPPAVSTARARRIPITALAIAALAVLAVLVALLAVS